MIRSPRWLPLLCCAAAAALMGMPQRGVAQTIESVRLTLDNDLLALRGAGPAPDYDYTHGSRLSLQTDGAPGWGRLLARVPPCGARSKPRPACLSTTFEAGQKIYTPRVDASLPVPGERPYAAWLYAGATGSVTSESRSRSLAMAVGTIGPPALGEPVQNSVHRLVGSEQRRGWAHQLSAEPGVLVRYTDARLVLHRHFGRAGPVYVAPAWSIGIGNVIMDARIGAEARIGPGAAHPWRAASPPGQPPPRGAYALAGVREDGVLRNLFLDGSTFRESPRVRRLPLVTEWEAGAGYRFRSWSIEYRFVSRGREYRTQPGPHRYGSVSATVHR